MNTTTTSTDSVLSLQRLVSVEESNWGRLDMAALGCCWAGSLGTCPQCSFTCEASFG